MMFLLVHIISMSCLARLRQKTTSIFQNSNYGAAICLRCCPDGGVTVHFSVYVAVCELDVDIISGLWSQANGERIRFAFRFFVFSQQHAKIYSSQELLYCKMGWEAMVHSESLWWIRPQGRNTFRLHWLSCRYHCMPVFKAWIRFT